MGSRQFCSEGKYRKLGKQLVGGRGHEGRAKLSALPPPPPFLLLLAEWKGTPVHVQDDKAGSLVGKHPTVFVLSATRAVEADRR